MEYLLLLLFPLSGVLVWRTVRLERAQARLQSDVNRLLEQTASISVRVDNLAVALPAQFDNALSQVREKVEADLWRVLEGALLTIHGKVEGDISTVLSKLETLDQLRTQADSAARQTERVLSKAQKPARQRAGRTLLRERLAAKAAK